jgi:hypothetical protein
LEPSLYDFGTWTPYNKPVFMVNKIRNAKVEITTNTTEIQEIIRDYFESLYSNKFENLEETDRFLETCTHPKLNQEDINHLNRCLTQIMSLPKKEKSRT